MHSATGILIAHASGPFGDSIARTRPSDGRILLAPRFRISDEAHARKICKTFTLADQVYSDSPLANHQMWGAAATRPEISGYDAFMSQALRTGHQGWYFPDVPGEGDGMAARELMPGAIIPPPPEVEVNPRAQTLAGTTRLDTRLDAYGDLEYRYHHELHDPRLPDPPAVDVVVLALRVRATRVYLLDLAGDVALTYDTGWVATNKNPADLFLTAFASFKFGLLNEQFDIPLDFDVVIPQPVGVEDNNVELLVPPFVDLHEEVPVPRNAIDSLYGHFRWTITRRTRRGIYTWYYMRFDIKVTARPSYRRQGAMAWLRGIYDRINVRWNLDTRRRVWNLFPPERTQIVFELPTTYRTIVRVDNPHRVRVKLQLQWYGMTVNLAPRINRIVAFDTFNIPAIVRD